MTLTFSDKYDAWQGRGKGLVNKPLKPSAYILPPICPVTPAVMAYLIQNRAKHLAKLVKYAKRR